MATTNGILSCSDIVKVTDSLVPWFNLVRPTLGLSAYTETGTLSALSQTAKDAILGNGSSVYGIGSAEVQSNLKSGLNFMITSSRWDSFVAPVCQQVYSVIDAHISQNLPTGWSFSSSTGRALDQWLMRCNATATGTPAAPTGSVTVTAITGGSIPACASGDVLVVLTYVGASDWLESLPSSVIACPALAGPKSAYTLAVSGNVPAGVTKIRVYRCEVGDTGGSKLYASTVSATAGAAHPTITLSESDNQLRQDVTPPSWAQALLLPEAAAMYAMTWSPATSAVGTLVSQSMATPSNVYATPVSGFLGVGNTAATATLGYRAIGSTFVSGNVQSTNSANVGIQGMLGGLGVRARVTATLNAGASLSSITYWYISSSNPTTPTSGTISGPLSLAAPIDSVVDLSIPAGRIVTSITTDTCGTAASGTYIYEALPISR